MNQMLAQNQLQNPNPKKAWFSQYWMFLLVALYFAFSVWFISPFGEFPLNDDWVYAQAVQHFMSTGSFFMPTTCSACFLQILAGAAVCKLAGFSYAALRFVSLSFGFLGGVALFFLLRELGSGKKMSTLLTFIYLSNPLVLQLCFTFMTDIPAISLTNAYMLFLVRGLKRQSALNLLIAAAFFIGAIFVRQGTILFVVSNLLVLSICLFRFRSGFKSSQERNKAILLAGVLLVSLIVVPAILSFACDYWLKSSDKVSDAYMWLRNNHETFIKQLMHTPMKASFSVLIKLGQVSMYMSLFCLPVLVPFLAFFKSLFVKNSKIAAVWFLSSAAVIVTTLTKLVAGDHVLMPVNQNMLRIPIIGAPNLLGVSIAIINERQRWWLTQISAILAALMLSLIGGTVQYSLALVRKFMDCGKGFSRAACTVYMTSACAVCLVVLAIETVIMDIDRHYLVVFPPIIICLALAQRWYRLRPMWWLSASLAILMAVYSTMANQDYLSWNRARYEAAYSLEAKGVAVKDIDAGAEYDFSHDVGLWIETFKNFQYKRTVRDNWRWWRVRDDKYIVSFSPVPMYEEVGVVPYFSALTMSEKKILILKRVEESAQTKPADKKAPARLAGSLQRGL